MNEPTQARVGNRKTVRISSNCHQKVFQRNLVMGCADTSPYSGTHQSATPLHDSSCMVVLLTASQGRETMFDLAEAGGGGCASTTAERYSSELPQPVLKMINWVGKSGRLYQPFCMWTPPGGNEKNALYYLPTDCYYRVTYVDNDTVITVTRLGTSFKTKIL